MGIDPSRVRCDAVEFLAALERDDPEGGLGHYGGDYLEGFFVPEAPEFESWLQLRRDDLRARAAEAAWEVATRKRAAGKVSEATAWARRSLALAPYDERALRRVMTLLDAVGERSGAVVEYEEFARRLEQELELEPAPETGALVESIRERDHAATDAAPVTIPRAGRVAPAEPFGARVEPPDAGTRARPRLPAALVAAALAAVLALATIDLWVGKISADGVPSESLTLAVLPFENLSPDSADAFFAAGMHEEILTQLGTLRGIRLLSRSAVRPYEGTDRTLESVARELGADHLIEGSVRRDGRRVRITIRLLRAESGEELWSEIYDERMADVFRIQTTIAGSVARALGARLSPVERRRAPTGVIAAYDHYLRGKLHADRELDLDAAWRAVREFERAVELDPRYAAAWAELARERALLTVLDPSLVEQADRARSDLARARDLDGEAMETLIADGYVHYYIDRDYEAALESFHEARLLAPNDPAPIKAIAFIRRRQGAWEDALSGLERALELDPRSFELALEAGRTNKFLRRPGLATERLELALAISPETPLTYLERIQLEISTGDTAAARRLASRADFAAHVNPGLPDYFARDFEAALARWSTRGLFEEVALGVMYRRLDRRADLAGVAATLRERAEAVPADGDDRARARRSLWLGLADALEGKREAAVAHGRLAVASLPIEEDAFEGPAYVWALAVIHTLVGDRDEAVGRLAEVLSVPAPVSVGHLRVDPVYDDLREHPGFRRLVGDP